MESVKREKFFMAPFFTQSNRERDDWSIPGDQMIQKIVILMFINFILMIMNKTNLSHKYEV